MKHCHARTRAGRPCSGYAVRGSNFCFTHDPAHAQSRREAHQRGGRHRRRGSPPAPFPDVDARTAEGLSQFLDRLLRETWSLENSVDRTRALAYLARVQRDLLQTKLLESRIAALEAVLRGRTENEPDPQA